MKPDPAPVAGRPGPMPLHFRGAASGGRYWWIFYRDGNDHLTAVMPVRLQEFTKLVEKEK